MIFRRGLLALGLAFGLVAQAISATPAAAQANLSSESKYSAIVVDADSGEVLFGRRADSPRYPASVTKIMTLYLTFEAIASGKLAMNDTLPISRHAAAQAPTKLGLSEGQFITVEDAIQAIAVQSANDIAVAMAEKLGGTESRFAAMMSLRAEELGMTNTRYVNASGLPDSRQISTARDLAVLSRAVMRDYPQFYAYLGQKQFSYEGRTMNNHNGLLLRMAGVDGLKTGFTTASGYNLAASATRDRKRLIVVVLGGKSNANRDNQVADLLETGFDVLHRRGNGEAITIAQNIFDPPSGRTYAPATQEVSAETVQLTRLDKPASGMRPVPNPVRPVSMKPVPNPETSEGDEDGDSVALASNEKPKAVKAKSEASAAGLRPSQVATKEKTAAGRYMVQVGAFKQKSDAKTQLSLTTQRFGDHFSAAEASIGDAVGGSFRARFTGLTESAAKAACAALKAKKQVCMVVAP
jgi:D-alanyl-D-alanine carboxypeptidase